MDYGIWYKISDLIDGITRYNKIITQVDSTFFSPKKNSLDILPTDIFSTISLGKKLIKLNLAPIAHPRLHLILKELPHYEEKAKNLSITNIECQFIYLELSFLVKTTIDYILRREVEALEKKISNLSPLPEMVQ